MRQSGILIVLLTWLLCSCLGCKKEQSQTCGKTVDDTDVKSVKNSARYFFEPSVSTLTGVVKQETFWGPPNYGEDTATDRKERIHILVLDSPIRVAPAPGSNTGEAADGIERIQLVTTKSIDSFNEQRVTVKGTLFTAQSGHHRTEVLLNLSEIK